MIGRINWRPSHRDIRMFGVVLIVGFGIVASLLAWRGKGEAARWVISGAGAVGLLSIAIPRVGGLFYRVWMAVGFCMGFVVSRVILVLIFFVVFTPVAVIFKLMKRDKLDLERPSGPTYWKELPPVVDKEDYSHLF